VPTATIEAATKAVEAKLEEAKLEAKPTKLPASPKLAIPQRLQLHQTPKVSFAYAIPLAFSALCPIHNGHRTPTPPWL